MAEVLRRRPRAGGVRLVTVDGRAGAGKTTLAAEMAGWLARQRTVSTVAMDDLYEGWSGLPGVSRRVDQALVGPLGRGWRPRLRAWDWTAARWGAAFVVPRTDVVIVEGCGAWSRAIAGRVSLHLWVDAPVEVRRARAMRRDGAVFAQHWDDWAAAEERLLVREGARGCADVVWAGG